MMMMDSQDIEYDREIFKINFNFLAKELNKSFDNNDTWYRFDRVIDAFHIDEKVSNPKVFDLLRKLVYGPIVLGIRINFIKSLDTLNDQDIKFLVCQMRCKVYDEQKNEITDFIPNPVAEYLLNRITNIFETQLA